MRHALRPCATRRKRQQLAQKRNACFSHVNPASSDEEEMFCVVLGV